MKKQIFKVGDTVYHGGFGEGKVVGIAGPYHPICVQFAHGKETFTDDGKYMYTDPFPTLSLTPYTLQGFSQERPIDYNDYIGKWGSFYDEERNSAQICKLKEFRPNGITYRFVTEIHGYYMNFQPLSDEAVGILKKEGIIKE